MVMEPHVRKLSAYDGEDIYQIPESEVLKVLDSMLSDVSVKLGPKFELPWLDNLIRKTHSYWTFFEQRQKQAVETLQKYRESKFGNRYDLDKLEDPWEKLRPVLTEQLSIRKIQRELYEYLERNPDASWQDIEEAGYGSYMWYRWRNPSPKNLEWAKESAKEHMLSFRFREGTKIYPLIPDKDEDMKKVIEEEAFRPYVEYNIDDIWGLIPEEKLLRTLLGKEFKRSIPSNATDIGLSMVVEYVQTASKVYGYKMFKEIRRKIADLRRRVPDQESQELRKQVEKVLGLLSEREQRVLKLRFGLEDGKYHTLEEVGKEFDVTRERIRTIEAKGLRKIRSRLMKV